MAVILGIMVLQFIFIYAFFIEPNWIAIKRMRIKSPILAGALKDCRIVQISDLHIEKVGILEMSLIEKINRLKPDLILITGDFVDTREGISACWDVLSLLEARAGIYAVPGDMDDYHVPDLLDDPHWKKAGVTMLDDRALKLNLAGEKGRNFWLVGLHRTTDLKALLDKIPEYEPILLMSPDPSYIREASLCDVDLVLAGDTHGGQINPRLLRGLFPFAVENRGPYVAGLFKVRDTFLYVNRGIGTSHINARFFCRPEITVFEFAEKGFSSRPKILPQDREI